MKSHGICSPMKSSRDKIWLFTIYLIGLIISNSPVNSYPSWDTQTTITGMCLESNKYIENMTKSEHYIWVVLVLY